MADIIARGMSADAKAYTNSVLVTGQKPRGTLNSATQIPSTASVGDWYTCNFKDVGLGINAGNRILFNTTTTYVVDTYAINGKDGADGYTPQKGVDYRTDEDIATIDSHINTQIGGALNGSY